MKSATKNEAPATNEERSKPNDGPPPWNDDPRSSPQQVDPVPLREAALAYAAALHPEEYVDQMLDEFSAIEFAHPVTKRVAKAAIRRLADEQIDEGELDRDLAVLRSRLPSPPGFVSGVNVDGFAQAMRMQIVNQGRRRLRSARTPRER